MFKLKLKNNENTFLVSGKVETKNWRLAHIIFRFASCNCSPVTGNDYEKAMLPASKHGSRGQIY